MLPSSNQFVWRLLGSLILLSFRFILAMVLYNLFSVPYIVSFVASENCGEGNALRKLLLPLSMVNLSPEY